ncbi:uncharacterized protein [Ptychodera flava]|uniref:uncharacterized protein n=1 Tax=Ptychodera flava TaxID=63121 RepID=UPI003969FE75
MTQKNIEKHKQEPQAISRNGRLQERDQGDMKVKVRVSEVVPENGRTVVEVERGFYESEEVKEKTEEVGQTLDGQHDEMKVKDVGHESISYTMSCQSLDALEYLRGEYENGKLQDLMEDEFLSDELLDKIGAFYLAIDVTIDYDEYFLCRKELIQKYGLSVDKRDAHVYTVKKQPMEPQKTVTAPKRVNRARDLLKHFDNEGDKVTESQINMLDQLLKEKEEKRQMGHQQLLQESEQVDELSLSLPTSSKIQQDHDIWAIEDEHTGSIEVFSQTEIMNELIFSSVIFVKLE